MKVRELLIGAGLGIVGGSCLVLGSMFVKNYQRDRAVNTKQLPVRLLPLTNAKLISGLRENVLNNKALPAFFSSIDANDEYLLKLQAAVVAGDLKSDVFNQLNSLKYLTYLIESERIPYWHGITAYTYALANLQFGLHQEFPGLDNTFNAKSRGYIKMSVQPLVINNELTTSGTNYIDTLCENFLSFGFKLDAAELKEFILHSAPIEQNLVRFDYSGYTIPDEFDGPLIYSRRQREEDYSPISRYMHTQRQNNLLLRFGHNSICTVPPMTFINFVLSKMSKEPMQIKPVFGSVKTQKMELMHYSNQHPGALYSPLVLSNMTRADNNNVGPYLIWLHDISHVFMANLLSTEERAVIFNDLIHALNRADVYANGKIIHNKYDPRVTLSDLDLSDISTYTLPDRFSKFIKHSLHSHLHFTTSREVKFFINEITAKEAPLNSPLHKVQVFINEAIKRHECKEINEIKKHM